MDPNEKLALCQALWACISDEPYDATNADSQEIRPTDDGIELVGRSGEALFAVLGAREVDAATH